MSKVSIRDSLIHGKGVFADCFIKQGKICCYFTGNINTQGEYGPYSTCGYQIGHCLNGYNYPKLIDEYGVQADKYCGSLVNHSTKNNCFIGRDIDNELTVIVSTEDIPPNTELVLNYLEQT